MAKRQSRNGRAEAALDLAESMMEDRNGGGGENPILAAKEAKAILARKDDDVPPAVRDSIWAVAIKMFPVPKRGTNPKTLEEYYKRCDEYLARRAAKAERARQKKADKKAASIVAASVGVELVESVEDIVQVAEKVEIEIAENWEDLDKEPYESYMHPKNLVHTCEVKREDEKLTFKIPHNHKVLAESRKVGDRTLRLKALGRAMRELGTGKHVKPAVVDVGAGATGVRGALDLIRNAKDADRVYHHCMFPFACVSDMARDNTLCQHLKHINWMREGVEPELGKVNVCTHLAKQCTCLRHYTKCFVMTVHAHYYFDDLDWNNLFRYTDVVDVYGHMPGLLNRPMPAESPEFEWRKPRDAKTLSWSDKLKTAAREYIYGQDDLVVFEPLAAHGTTYVHRDPKLDVEAGGFHFTDGWATRIKAWVDSPGGTQVTAALKTAGVAVATYGVVSGVLNRNWTDALTGIVSGFLFSAPANVAKSCAATRISPDPPSSAAYTVHIVNGESVEYMGEEIAHFFKYMKTPLTKLEPRSLVSYKPNVQMAKEIASTLVLSKKDEQTTQNIAVAKCLRAGMNDRETADTISEAKTILESIGSKNGVSVARLCPSIPVIVGYPSVWGTRQSLQLAVTAGVCFIVVPECVVLSLRIRRALVDGLCTFTPDLKPALEAYWTHIRRSGMLTRVRKHLAGLTSSAGLLVMGLSSALAPPTH